MRRIVVLIFFLQSLFYLQGHAQQKDQAAMVKKIFTVLQNKDEEGFVKLFPDAATIKVFFAAKYAKYPSTENENRRQLNETIAMLTDSILQSNYRESFREVIEKGEKKGIDWEKTGFVSYVSDSTFNKQEKMYVLSGKIYFNTDEKEYFLVYDETTWFENYGWYGVDIRRIDEKSKENEPEVFEWDGMADSVALATTMMVDTTMKLIEEERPAANPKTNTKQPLKNKTPKIKLQTPARKPEL